VHHLQQKAGELWACSPASPLSFCVLLSDLSVQALLSLQNLPECAQLIAFKLIVCQHLTLVQVHRVSLYLGFILVFTLKLH